MVVGFLSDEVVFEMCMSKYLLEMDKSVFGFLLYYFFDVLQRFS